VRILHVLEATSAGAFRHVEGLTSHLLESGHHVDLAYSSRRADDSFWRFLRRLEGAGGTSVDLDTGPAPHPLDVRALLRLRAFARRCRPDVVHAHSSKAGALARMRPGFGPTPVVYTPHAFYGMGRQGTRREQLFNTVERHLAHRAHTVAISPDEATFGREVLGIDPDRITTIHNPVDTSRFRPADPARRREARALLGVPEHGRVLGTVARLTDQKDFALTYDVVLCHLRRHPDAWFVHVGDGPGESAVAAILDAAPDIRGRVVRLKPTGSVDDVYAALDGFLLTSRYEAGWPLVVLEAMAFDLPLVVTSAPGMSDLGDAGLSHAWTAPVGDADGLVHALEQWRGATAEGRAANHRQIAQERFSPAVLYGRVVELYERTLTPSA
jgi:glycosyltransferase involved in cell wall biosynthesis